MKELQGNASFSKRCQYYNYDPKNIISRNALNYLRQNANEPRVADVNIIRPARSKKRGAQ
jgi:hypothetical protein